MTVLLMIALALGSVGTVAEGGTANFATRSHGDHYLAMRLPRGTVVTICGAGGCWRGAIVNDFGPKPSTGDIADIALGHFAHVCGYTVPEAKRRGECSVTVEVHGTIKLPETSTAPTWWDWHELVR